MDHVKLQENWQNAYIVPLYKGKEDKGECLSKGVNLFSVPLCGRVVIERVKECTKDEIMNEKFGFRNGKG